jgi:acyl carrier protein
VAAAGLPYRPPAPRAEPPAAAGPADLPAPAAAVHSSFLNPGAPAAAAPLARTAANQANGGRILPPEYRRPQIAEDAAIPSLLTASSLDGTVQAAAPLAPRAPTTGAAPAAAGPGAAPAAPAVDLRAELFAAVADKTGYPADMLEPAMDLEGDLGIDSIKRVEILAAVQQRVPALPELDNERMAALRTLHAVEGYLRELLGGAPPPAPAPTAAPEQGIAALSPALRRRVVSVVPAPVGRALALSTARLVGDDAVVAPVAAALAARGVAVVDGPADAVVFLGALGRRGEALDAAVREAFTVARAAGAPRRFAVVTDQDGAHGCGDGTDRVALGALAGLAKTLSHEWPGCAALALDLDAFDAEAVADELLADRGAVEIGRRGADALTLATVDEALPERGDAPIAAGELVVVSGGARGVTAAVAIELARRHRARLLLLGRSAVGGAEPDWALGVPEAGLTAACAAGLRAAGARPTPKVVDAEVRAVRAAREVRATLDAIRAAGAEATYAAVDIRDAAAVRAAIAAAGAPVRGIVHGAGVIADKRIEDKTDDAFDRVYGTKVDGIRALLSAVDPADLRFAALFGSVAGRFGNLGQSDYAMANEVLARVARQLSRGGVRAVCFAWGPWAGGMVDAALEKQLTARGMALIPVDGGAAFCVDELGRGEAPEVVVGGPEGGALLGEAAPRAEVHRLDPSAAFLRDHRIDGKPVLPAVMVLEWMARAAHRAFPGLAFAEVRDFAVLKGVVLDGGDGALRLEWEEQPAAEGAARTLAFRLVGEGGGRSVVHYRGTVDLVARADGPRPFPGSNGLGGERYPYAVDEAYRRFLFHGPGLRGIQEVMGYSDHGIVARVRTSRPESLDEEGSTWETDPVALDSLLQLMVLWVREKTGAAALPSALGRYRQHAPLRGDIVCHVEMHPTRTATGSFGATLVDADGNVVATLEQGQYTASAAMNDAFRSA